MDERLCLTITELSNASGIIYFSTSLSARDLDLRDFMVLLVSDRTGQVNEELSEEEGGTAQESIHVYQKGEGVREKIERMGMWLLFLQHSFPHQEFTEVLAGRLLY